MVVLEQSKKGEAIRELVRREFEKGRAETDPEKIEALKAKYAPRLAHSLGSDATRLTRSLCLQRDPRTQQLPRHGQFEVRGRSLQPCTSLGHALTYLYLFTPFRDADACHTVVVMILFSSLPRGIPICSKDKKLHDAMKPKVAKPATADGGPQQAEYREL